MSSSSNAPTPAPTPGTTQEPLHLAPGVHRHEESDVSPRAVLWTGLALLTGLVLIHGVLWMYLTGLNFAESKVHAAKPTVIASERDVQPVLPPQPRLQTDEAADLAKLHDAENERLTSYGWIDRKSGVAHIPVTRAMELIVQRGLPVFDSDKPGADTEAGRIRGPALQAPEVKP